MRGFELTQAKQDFLWEGLGKRSYPASVVWGRDDPAWAWTTAGSPATCSTSTEPTLVPAKHFLQEDQAPAIADAVAEIA